MTQWQTFLSSQGASWKDGAPCHFEAANGAKATVLVPMEAHRLLTATGPDASRFLQGQCTCDLRKLVDNHHLLGAHCNPKGRMISSFAIAANGNGEITLRVRSNIAESALAALKKYIVFAKAEIQMDTRVALALIGPSAAAALAGAALPAPGHVTHQEELTVLNHGSDFFELWLDATRAQALWPRLVSHAQPIGCSTLDLHLIRAGLAEVQSETQESFIPQMFNYQILDGISFKKGCYTGQEIIARMQYRGELKKHTYRAQILGREPVPVGTSVYFPDTAEKSVGTIVASALTAEAHEALVVTTEDTSTKTTPLKIQNSSAELSWLDLPYAIT